MSDNEVESQRRAVDRLTFFSDAVVAIAITLLAIDLPVPKGATTSQYWSSVRHNGGHYMAFALSFVVIAAAWNHHHDIFRYAQSMDSRLRTLNTAWLATIVLNPFATRLLTSQGGHQPRGVHALQFGFYSLVQALSSGALLALLHHMLTHHQVPGMPATDAAETTWLCIGFVAGFGLAIPVFFVTTYGWVLWFAGPVIGRQVYRARERSQLRQRAG